MKGKGLVPLLIIALVLVGLVIWKRTSTPTRTLKQQINLVALLPEDLAEDDVGKLELYSGAKPDEKVVLARDGDDWRLESHYNAPVAETKIEEFLKSLNELQGEFRETAASDDTLKAFNLTEDAAFHVLGYKEGAEEPAFHLLVGKAADYRTVFVRTEGQQEVYVEDTNLRQLAGVYGEDTAAAPTATPWLDKTVLEVDQEKITKLEITGPDKTLVFEKQEITPPAPEQPEETPEGETPPPPPAPEYKWAVAAGGPGGEFKEAGLTSVLRKIASLTATDIVDPAQKAEWGLEPPQFKAVVAVEGQDDVVIEGGRPEGAADGYIRLASAQHDRVYKLDSYSFNQLFPKGSQLFTLPTFTVAADSINRIEVTQPDGGFVAVRSDDTWDVESPKANLPVQATTVDTIETVLTAWKPEDYADPAADTGLDNAQHTAVFSVGGDDTKKLVVGNPSKYFDGYYARMEGTDLVLGMTKTDYQKIFVEPENLYQLKLLDLTSADVQSVAIERPEDPFTITKTEDTWAFTAGPAATEIDQDKATDLIDKILAIQATDIIFEGAPDPNTAIATIRLTAADGATHTLTVAPEQDGRYPVIIAEKEQAVWVDKAEMDEALAPSPSLTVQPQEAPAPAAEPTAEAPAEETTIEIPAAPEPPAANSTVEIPVTPQPTEVPAQ